MIILITGATHTGKTMLSQKLLEQYHYPYLSSMDHVKMGLIRSGITTLTPEDDEKMTGFLWPIIREIIKTAIENEQNRCYVPADWEQDFTLEYREKIRFRCLVMAEDYIRSHFDTIRSNASVIEQRGADIGFDMETAIRENKRFLDAFRNTSKGLILIEKDYKTELEEYSNMLDL